MDGIDRIVLTAHHWLRGRSRRSCHAAAVSLALAWMVKPQLLMAAAFFLACAAVELRRTPAGRSRAAGIGRLILPWSALLIALSLPLALPASLAA